MNSKKLAMTFNRMIERLQENLEKQKRFVSDASHELKTASYGHQKLRCFIKAARGPK